MLREFPVLVPIRTATATATAPSAPADLPDVPIRHAATVMLVRPAGGSVGGELGVSGGGAVGGGRGGVEVFAFRRRPSLVFAAGMLVFPGGAVESGDADEDLPWAGPPPSDLAEALSADESLARAVVAGAVRETFEECGVLIAGPADGGPIGEPLDTDAWEERRHALVAGELSLAELLRATGLRVRADLLRPWAHWLTPPGESRRFDTRFFVAALPAGQDARDLGGEGERAAWVAPSEVLAGYRDGTVPMLPPTVVSMEELGVATSVEDLLATQRRPRPVSPWLERLDVDEDGEPRYVMRIDLDGLGGGEPGPGAGSGAGAGAGPGAGAEVAR